MGIVSQDFSSVIKTNPVFDVIGSCADELGWDCYLIGGFVRDTLLKKKSKDVDFMTVGNGIRLAELVSKRLKGSDIAVYKKFGTALVRWKDFHLEFVGARKESYRADSRKPIVEDGTLEDDQKRRDFTINTLAVGVSSKVRGDFIDPFEGLRDLNTGNIRTPLEPEITFSDDPLRMLRAIRFASQLNFDIDASTFDAIIRCKDRLSIVSQERITDELNKIIMSTTPSYGFKLLFHSGLLLFIFPEMTRLHGVDKKYGQLHKDNFYHTLQVLDNVSAKSDNLWLRWAAILHDIAKPVTKRFDYKVGWTFHGHEFRGSKMVPGIFRKLKLPLGDRMNYVRKLVKLHLRPIALVKDNITDSALRRLLFEAGEDIDDLMLLCKADITSKNDSKVRQYLKNFENVERKLQEVEEMDKLKNFQPPVDGQLIMDTFGLQPGREVGLIKDEIRESILEGTIPNEYEAAFSLLLKIGKKHGFKHKK